MPSYEHILLRSEVKERLKNLQRKLKKSTGVKQFSMSDVIEYLLTIEKRHN